DLARLVELRLGHRRGLRVGVLVHLLTGQRRTACLVANLGLGDFLLVRLRPSDGRRRREHPSYDCCNGQPLDSCLHLASPCCSLRLSDPVNMLLRCINGAILCRNRAGRIDSTQVRRRFSTSTVTPAPRQQRNGESVPKSSQSASAHELPPLTARPARSALSIMPPALGRSHHAAHKPALRAIAAGAALSLLSAAQAQQAA